MLTTVSMPQCILTACFKKSIQIKAFFWSKMQPVTKQIAIAYTKGSQHFCQLTPDAIFFVVNQPLTFIAKNYQCAGLI